MKCPNCGEEMSEQALYCEHCGEDIHIVPDFEIAVEENIREAMEGIAIDAEETKSVTKVKKPHKGFMKVLIMLISAIAFLAIAMFAVNYSRYYSYEYQLMRANESTALEQYDEAVSYYERALELRPGDVAVKFALTEVYFRKNNKIEYEYMLRDIVKDSGASTDDLNVAYGKLIAIYKAKNDYQTIHDLLLSSNNETIIATYQDYIARNPEMSLKDGDYTEIQPLKIVAMGNGKIYYTVNGGNPTVDSNQYIAPIVLDDGDYIVKAIFVNEMGIESEVVTGSYHVETDEIPAPEVSAVSGTYKYPIFIEVLSDDEDVYYTTDGSDPDILSNEYIDKIPMPIGYSIYKFAKIVDGQVGEITEKEYELKLDTEYSVNQAQTDVTTYVMNTGKIYDLEGHVYDSESVYKYVFQYAVTIDISDYYVIAEIISDSLGANTKTGNYFAVNIYSGLVYKLMIDSENNYSLVEIQVESQ